MWALQWTKCPVCGRDWGMRLASSMAAPRLTARRSWWAMALPTAPPEFDFPEAWDCSCGTRLRVGRRRYRACDFTMAGMIALTWGTVCLLTGMVFKYPCFAGCSGSF